ncbi:MAG: hypothetical protein ACP5NU_00685 [Methanomicrobiales archaeon]|nr:hypothetical protein [Methanoregulaceae archaeon]
MATEPVNQFSWCSRRNAGEKRQGIFYKEWTVRLVGTIFTLKLIVANEIADVVIEVDA